jgi:23S rRNA pseudouridine2605 synthase
VRLNRFLAAAGLGSRRACEAIITAGRVQVNGRPVTNLATTVLPEDSVKVDNRAIHAEQQVCVLLNKPVGFLSTRTDPGQRNTVFDLFPPDMPRLFHVGRLDLDSEGLLLLTNDGDLALRLTHPRYKIEKEYEVLLDRPFDTALTERLLRGVYIPVDNREEGGPPERVRAKAEAIHRLGANKLKVILRQGIKRQIRLMFLEVGYEVKRLERVRLGPLRLGRLKTGAWRYLDAGEVAALRGGEPAPKPRPKAR